MKALAKSLAFSPVKHILILHKATAPVKHFLILRKATCGRTICMVVQCESLNFSFFSTSIHDNIISVELLILFLPIFKARESFSFVLRIIK